MLMNDIWIRVHVAVFVRRCFIRGFLKPSKILDIILLLRPSRVSNAKPTKPVPPVRNALLFRIIVSTSMATRSFWMLAVPFVAEDLALRAVCFGNMKILIIHLSRGNPMYLAGTRLNHSAKGTNTL
ncbi:hypothetical protein ES332_D06G097200v1 [Gossypium tomentosum]|uniref:Uncharacterized protein n=1 Tax=Gossypium tomentosum TaxID=34277 RepID=A0A5D2KHJ8_GOSTO|nr:hypothetical protein ES332_D06G097200v1 [Gossypium tomentosum]